MTCNPELVSAYLDDELNDIIVESVVEHLMACGQCRQLMTLFCQTRESIRNRCIVPNPELLTKTIMTTISNEKVGKKSFFRRLKHAS